MRTFIRACLAVALAILVVVAAGRPTGAQAEGEQDDNLVVVTGRAEVRERESVDTVVIADGPALIAGTVRNGVVAFNGDVVVTGTVEDEVVAFNGRVTVRDGGVVEGDVVSRHEPVEEDGGRIEGSWERWDADAFNSAVGIFTWIAVWVAVSFSTLVLGLILALLAPRAARAVDEQRRRTHRAGHRVGPRRDPRRPAARRPGDGDARADPARPGRAAGPGPGLRPRLHDLGLAAGPGDPGPPRTRWAPSCWGGSSCASSRSCPSSGAWCGSPPSWSASVPSWWPRTGRVSDPPCPRTRRPCRRSPPPTDGTAAPGRTQVGVSRIAAIGPTRGPGR